jgi:cyclopropane fatty-acyl-phospholipid synthase-like methyltransferase
MAEGADKKIKPDTINALIANVYPALAMLAGMQLEVFTPLATGPKKVEELARILEVDASRLRPLLYALVSAGLLELDGEQFANGAEANRFLVKGQHGYMGGQHEAYADLWASTLLTAESIRTGKPQAKHDFAAMSRDELGAFLRGLDAGAAATARRIARSNDLSGFQCLLDAGGGGGGLAARLCRDYPQLSAVVADLPNVADIAAEMVAEHGLDDRLSVLACDVVAGPVPGRYDAAVLRAFLQVLGPKDAARVVANVGAAIEPGGTIFIMGRILDDDRLGPPDAVASNVMFLNIYDEGQAYTESEHRHWLTEAGFTDVQREKLGGGYSIIKALRT